MNSIQYLSRTEELQKIGELLAKGITLLLIREAEGQGTPTSSEQKERSSQPANIPNEQIHAQGTVELL